MKNYQKTLIFLILFGLFLNINVHSQSTNDVAIYNWFDTTVGKDNLDINNGIPHTNPFRTIDDNNLYFIDKYEKGTLTYDGQIYYNVKLKYDVYRDILALNPENESDNIGINLIKNKVESFTIQDKNFVKIDKKIAAVPEFTSGYYEEIKTTGFTFYIKHHKDQQKVIIETTLYYHFKENNSFFIDLNNTVYLIKGKNDIIKLFPEQKKQINGFYLMNRELRNSDLNQFMKNLMKYIANSISIQNK